MDKVLSFPGKTLLPHGLPQRLSTGIGGLHSLQGCIYVLRRWLVHGGDVYYSVVNRKNCQWRDAGAGARTDGELMLAEHGHFPATGGIKLIEQARACVGRPVGIKLITQEREKISSTMR